MVTLPHFASRPARRAALAAAALLGAICGPIHAQVDVYQLSPGAFPNWDTGNPTVWSLGAAPTATQTALFPAQPGANTINPDLRPDGTEVNLTNLNPLNVTPIANNVIFLGNYQLVSTLNSPFVAPLSFLTLNSGGITVGDQDSVLLDVNVFAQGGLITKLGNGALILDSGFSITGSALVAQGIFGGTGIIFGNLTNLATLAPGGINGPGVLTATGNFLQSRNATLSVGILSPTAFGQLFIGGRARLGGDLNVSLLNGFLPKLGEKFSILAANGGVSGKFDDVNAPVWDDLTLRPIYHKNAVTLDTVVDSFAALPGLTANERAIAQSIDSAINNPRATNLLNYLYGRSLGDLPKAFEKISPAGFTSMLTMAPALEEVQSINLQRRTEDVRNGAGGFSTQSFAITGDAPSYSGNFGAGPGTAGPTGDDGKEVKETREIAPADHRWGAFLAGSGEWVNVDGTSNARGYDLASGGFTLGVDYKVCPNFAIGIGTGYVGTTANLPDHGRVWVNGGKLGIYGTFFQAAPSSAPAPAMSKDSSKEAPAPAPVSTTGGGFYADFAAFGGYNGYSTRRNSIEGEARGNTDGGEINVLAGVGYDFKSGGFTFGPTASFNDTYVGFKDFTEHNSLTPLDIHGANSNSIRSEFGMRASYDFKCAGLIIRPEFRAAWQHEYGTAVSAIDANFADGAGNPFSVHGPRIGRDSCLLGAGFAVQVTDRIVTYVYYDGQVGRTNFDSNAVLGGIRVSF
jgi:outer membrane autotransporter protein